MRQIKIDRKMFLRLIKKTSKNSHTSEYTSLSKNYLALENAVLEKNRENSYTWLTKWLCEVSHLKSDTEIIAEIQSLTPSQRYFFEDALTVYCYEHMDSDVLKIEVDNQLIINELAEIIHDILITYSEFISFCNLHQILLTDKIKEYSLHLK